MVKIHYTSQEIQIYDTIYPLEVIERILTDEFPELILEHKISSSVKNEEISLKVDWKAILNLPTIKFYLLTNIRTLCKNPRTT